MTTIRGLGKLDNMTTSPHTHADGGTPDDYLYALPDHTLSTAGTVIQDGDPLLPNFPVTGAVIAVHDAGRIPQVDGNYPSINEYVGNAIAGPIDFRDDVRVAARPGSGVGYGRQGQTYHGTTYNACGSDASSRQQQLWAREAGILVPIVGASAATPAADDTCEPPPRPDAHIYSGDGRPCSPGDARITDRCDTSYHAGTTDCRKSSSYADEVNDSWWCMDGDSNYMRTICGAASHNPLPLISKVQFTDELGCLAGGRKAGDPALTSVRAAEVSRLVSGSPDPNVPDPAAPTGCRVTCEFELAKILPDISTQNDRDRCVQSGHRMDGGISATTGIFTTDSRMDSRLQKAIDNEMFRIVQPAIYDPSYGIANDAVATPAQDITLGNDAWDEALADTHCNSQFQAAGGESFTGSISNVNWPLFERGGDWGSVVEQRLAGSRVGRPFPELYPGVDIDMTNMSNAEIVQWDQRIAAAGTQEYKDLYYCMLNSRALIDQPPPDLVASSPTATCDNNDMVDATPAGNIQIDQMGLDSLCAPGCQYNGNGVAFDGPPDDLAERVNEIRNWREHFFDANWENSCNYSMIMEDLCANIEYKHNYCPNGQNYCSYFASTNPALNENSGGNGGTGNICASWAHKVATTGNSVESAPRFKHGIDEIENPSSDNSFEKKTLCPNNSADGGQHHRVETAIETYCSRLYEEFPVPPEGIDIPRDPVCGCYKNTDNKLWKALTADAATRGIPDASSFTHGFPKHCWYPDCQSSQPYDGQSGTVFIPRGDRPRSDAPLTTGLLDPSEECYQGTVCFNSLINIQRGCGGPGGCVINTDHITQLNDCQSTTTTNVGEVLEGCSDGGVLTPAGAAVAATCTGTATDNALTCDLDTATDSSDACPAGCTSVAAVAAVAGSCDTGTYTAAAAATHDITHGQTSGPVPCDSADPPLPVGCVEQECTDKDLPYPGCIDVPSSSAVTCTAMDTPVGCQPPDRIAIGADCDPTYDNCISGSKCDEDTSKCIEEKWYEKWYEKFKSLETGWQIGLGILAVLIIIIIFGWAFSDNKVESVESVE